jgi:hypothetical protein
MLGTQKKAARAGQLSRDAGWQGPVLWYLRSSLEVAGGLRLREVAMADATKIAHGETLEVAPIRVRGRRKVTHAKLPKASHHIGRPPGSLNRISRTLKDALVGAISKCPSIRSFGHYARMRTRVVPALSARHLAAPGDCVPNFQPSVSPPPISRRIRP